MARIFWLSAFIISLTVCIYGQQPAPAPAPTAAPAPTPNTTQVPRATPRMNSLPPLGSIMPQSAAGTPLEADPMGRRMLMVQQYAVPIYRKPSGKELRPLAPDPAIAAQYGDLLRREDSGIFKLVQDAGCAESTKVVNASEQCLKYLFPGAANSYSFRTESYRVRQLADITYVDGGFWVTGVLMHGLMVDLGDVPLEQVNVQSPALAFINKFQPAEDFGKALEADRLLVGGVRKDGFLYRRNLPVVAGHTYAIRSIAYQGRVMRSIKGAEYNELDFDKRVDVLTVFRVAKIDSDGTITIVWTRLASARSPKLKVPAKEGDEGFAGAGDLKKIDDSDPSRRTGNK